MRGCLGEGGGSFSGLGNAYRGNLSMTTSGKALFSLLCFSLKPCTLHLALEIKRAYAAKRSASPTRAVLHMLC